MNTLVLVEPLYKGQVGAGHLSLYSGTSNKGQVRNGLSGGASLQGTRILSGASQVGVGLFVPYTVEPLYKGQVGGGSFVTYTVEISTRDKLALYSRASLQGTSWGPLSLIQWSLFTRDKFALLVPCREVILFSL